MCYDWRPSPLDLLRSKRLQNYTLEYQFFRCGSHCNRTLPSRDRTCPEYRGLYHWRPSVGTKYLNQWLPNWFQRRSTYDFGLCWHAIFVTGHIGADLELFIEYCSIEAFFEQALLGFCLFSLTRPDNDHWHSLVNWNAQRLNFQSYRQISVTHLEARKRISKVKFL